MKAGRGKEEYAPLPLGGRTPFGKTRINRQKDWFYYRAMLCIRGTSHGPVSVRPSVRHKSVFY